MTGTAITRLAALDWGVMALYLGSVLVLGFVFSRSEKNTDAYLLGGRRMPWFVIGVSYMISLMSTISLVGIPGEAFQHGITKAFESAISPVASILSFYLFVRFYFRSKVFTPFSYLQERFDRRVRLLGSLVFWLTRLTYLALVLYSSSKVFEGAANWPVWLTVCVVGGVGIVYTTLGGMKAVVWTDFAQFLILVGGLTVITIQCASAVEGGLTGIFTYAFENGRGFEGFKDPAFYSIDPTVRLSLWTITIALVMEYLFYNSADQISIQRLLSTSSYESAKKSVYTFVIIGVPFAAVLWFLGLAMFSFYAQHPEQAAGVTGDTALFRFIAVNLPTPLPGLMLSAMLAAVMSTLDSGMNSLAAVATKDIYIQYFHPNCSETGQVRFSRIVTVCVGLFAVGVALFISHVSESVKDTVMESMTIWGSISLVLAPVFLIGVTTRKVTANQIIVTSIAAWAVTGFMIWLYLSTERNYTLAQNAIDYLTSARLLPPGWPNPVRRLSFMFVSMPGLLTMFVLGYGSLLIPGTIDHEKVKGLTLWTLEKKREAKQAGKA